MTVGFKYKLFRVHVLAWVIQTGEWPQHRIDHINRNPADNRWCNLRPATQSQNMSNLLLTKASTSGHKGVHWHRAAGKWTAKIKVNKKSFYLGLFDNIENAIEAYRDASKKLHGAFSPYH
jgi:hypothetical protein